MLEVASSVAPPVVEQHQVMKKVRLEDVLKLRLATSKPLILVSMGFCHYPQQ